MAQLLSKRLLLSLVIAATWSNVRSESPCDCPGYFRKLAVVGVLGLRDGHDGAPRERERVLARYVGRDARRPCVGEITVVLDAETVAWPVDVAFEEPPARDFAISAGKVDPMVENGAR